MVDDMLSSLSRRSLYHPQRISEKLAVLRLARSFSGAMGWGCWIFGGFKKCSKPLVDDEFLDYTIQIYPIYWDYVIIQQRNPYPLVSKLGLPFANHTWLGNPMEMDVSSENHP